MKSATRAAWLAALTLTLVGAGRAHAQSDAFSLDAFHGLVDVTLSGGDTERSWLDGGFGKAGPGAGGLQLTQAAVEWRPRLSFGVSAVVTGLYQAQVSPKFDLGEAYLNLRAPPSEFGRFSGRVGIFYPLISQEHDGVAWTAPDMLSASVLNSWVGEEVKVVGGEVSFQRGLGAGQVELTAGVFGGDDTAGTLLTFRGWAGHGIRAGVRTEFGLPPLSRFASKFQYDGTYPIRELDNRAGYYGRIEWRPPAPVSFNAFYYDNLGDRRAVDSHLQWAWETRFANLGVKWEVNDKTHILAQAMNGETLMGYVIPGGIWFDMGFQSAYIQAAHKVGEDTVTGRLEGFRTHDRTFVVIDNNNEHGWALTGAWRHRLARHADLIFEAQHIASDRPARVLAGDSPKQGETLLQTALRLSF